MGVPLRVMGSPIDHEGWSHPLIAGIPMTEADTDQGKGCTPPREGATGPRDGAILHMTSVRPTRCRARPYGMKDEIAVALPQNAIGSATIGEGRRRGHQPRNRAWVSTGEASLGKKNSNHG